MYMVCVLNFMGEIFMFLIGKKICGVLIFVEMAVCQVQSLSDLLSMLVIVD